MNNIPWRVRDKMNIREYWIDILFTLLAVIPVCVSLYIDINTIENEYYWFQRSGSIMVLFAVALDFEQSKYTKTKESSSLMIEGKPAIIGQVLSITRVYIQRFSIVLIVLGTAIWGYGDLLFK